MRPTASLLLALVSLLLSLAAAELFLRRLYPCPWYGYVYAPPQQRLFEHDPHVGWRGRPDATAVFASTDFRVGISHDRYGHRTSAEPWREGVHNAVVLGDSYAWGWGVEDDEIFAERMMQRSDDLNVYNLGAPGYGTDQEYLALERFFEVHPEARPGSVVLQFYWNDWLNNMASEQLGYPKPRFVVRGGTLRLVGVPVPDLRQRFDASRRLEKVPTTFLNDLHLYNLALERRHVRYREEDARAQRLHEGDARSQNAITLRLMRAVAELARGRGARLLVVLLYPESTPRWDALRAGLDESGIAHVGFDASGSLGRTRLWIDGHLNARGHELLASRILEALPLE